MSENVLEVRNLVKDYRLSKGKYFRAVDGINFQIKAGQCFSLLGPNGAGKSTTMNCVTGFFPCTEGHVKILGIDVHLDPRKARQKLGVCSQDDSLDTDFTVLHQMERYASFFKMRRKEAYHRSMELLEQFQLLDKKDQPADQLSGGMRRRLQVARAFLNRPKLVILDEPTTGLDPEVRRSLWTLLEKARSEGAAILLSTHYMDEAQRLSDVVALMNQGKIADCDTPDRLIERHVGKDLVEEEVRPGIHFSRPANLEDVYMEISGRALQSGPAASSSGENAPTLTKANSEKNEEVNS